MNIAIRLFLGYFLIVGLAAWFVLNIFTREVQPGVRQATKDTLVDTAHLLAELAAPELTSGPLDQFADGAFARAVNAALERSPHASIWGVPKESVDFRVYLTDAKGIVVFDSSGDAVGADYSRWQDVARVLRGEYGARSTREDPADPESSVLYVAAPVLAGDQLVGVLSVAKPAAALTPYSARAARRVKQSGVWLLAVSALIGILFTLWLTWSLNRLRDYARAVAAGERRAPPTQGGHQLSELARALADMRERLDGKQYVENYVQNLAHELKSPLSALRAAAEVLQEDPPAEDRRLFARHIGEQAERMQLIIERLLALARVEQQQVPEDARPVRLIELAQETVASRQSQLAARRLQVDVIELNASREDAADRASGVAPRSGESGESGESGGRSGPSESGACSGSSGSGAVRTYAASPAASVLGDRFLLRQALGNLLDNAIEFSPDDGRIAITIGQNGDRLSIAVRDHGPGAPDYALPQLFERFYSLPRPATGRKSTGLGLAFVREVARLHGGEAGFENAADGGAVARRPAALSGRQRIA